MSRADLPHSRFAPTLSFGGAPPESKSSPARETRRLSAAPTRSTADRRAPRYMVCAVSGKVMDAPVRAADGRAYQAAALEQRLTTRVGRATLAPILQQDDIPGPWPDHLLAELVRQWRDGTGPELALNPDNPPKHLRCPITGDAYRDPVQASDGYTYDLHALAWHVGEDRTSPITGEPLEPRVIRNRSVARQLRPLIDRVGVKKLLARDSVVSLDAVDLDALVAKTGLPTGSARLARVTGAFANILSRARVLH